MSEDSQPGQVRAVRMNAGARAGSHGMCFGTRQPVRCRCVAGGGVLATPVEMVGVMRVPPGWCWCYGDTLTVLGPSDRVQPAIVRYDIFFTLCCAECVASPHGCSPPAAAVSAVGRRRRRRA